jgi:hypothetical protein
VRCVALCWCCSFIIAALLDHSCFVLIVLNSFSDAVEFLSVLTHYYQYHGDHFGVCFFFYTPLMMMTTLHCPSSSARFSCLAIA